MKNKQFLGLSIFMCILAFVFMVVSIFNADWAISLKGYYIVCISWIATSVFNLVRVLRDKEEGFPVGGEAVFLGWASLIVSTLIMIYNTWNTDWDLHFKGYYWLGTAFVLYSSYVVADQLRNRQEEARKNPNATLETKKPSLFNKNDDETK